MGTDVAGFAAIAALITISPGADFALVTRRALASGPREACVTAAGICTGVLAWAALSAVGVAAVVAASPTAYDALRIAGAAYLVLLGLLALREARRHLAREQAAVDAAAPRAPRTAFAQGLVNNLLNPKVAVFYAAVLPQFVAPGDPVLAVSLLLALCHAVMGMAWYGLTAWAIDRGRNLFRRRRIRAALEGTTAAAMVAIGIRAAI